MDSAALTDGFSIPMARASSSVCGSGLPRVSGRVRARQAEAMVGTPRTNMGKGAQMLASSGMYEDVVPKILGEGWYIISLDFGFVECMTV